MSVPHVTDNQIRQMVIDAERELIFYLLHDESPQLPLPPRSEGACTMIESGHTRDEGCAGRVHPTTFPT